MSGSYTFTLSLMSALEMITGFPASWKEPYSFANSRLEFQIAHNTTFSDGSGIDNEFAYYILSHLNWPYKIPL